MNKLYEQHLEAYTPDVSKALKKRLTETHTCITTEWMGKFAEWLNAGLWTKTEVKGKEYKQVNGWYNTHNYEAMEKPLTTAELIQLFIQNKNQ